MDQRSARDILAGKTYFIRTFGCQMNQHDSERVSGLLDSYGCLMALDPENADIVVFVRACSPMSITSMSSLARILSPMLPSSLPRRFWTASVISAPMSMRTRMP